ncbi:T9SS type A sorting domain-containing protein [uncultured Nonlabens sp.]|uniref:T9SS type A sorting domain-containing protein n=1 Tax=uncultured Nonlabens sp. TaxID=859306 RepID=UPI002603A77D|nr:T9SS type A sorting domain-containing protein [uncultured Nonlabens sp.]
MKITILLITLLSSILSFSQLSVHVIPLTTNDLVYDGVTNKIYASIPSANGANGNSIGVINPDTYLLENTVFMGSEPDVMAIADNGQYIYVGFNGSSTVRRFNVALQTAEIQFGLGADTSGPNYAEDIEVMPGHPQTIAVSRRNIGLSPRHEGVAIYDDGVARNITTPDHSGSNKIEFTSANSLIGFNNESTEFGIRNLSVNDNGVTNVNLTRNVLSNFGLNFSYWSNRMYAHDGKVVDISSSPFVIGQFSNVSGPAVFDTYYNKVAFASFNFSGNIEFKRYNPNTFLLTDSLNITQASGTVQNIITCGNGCYAFNSSDNKVIIIKDATLSTETVAAEISIYPNPTANYLNIKSSEIIETIQIIDVNGRIIENMVFENSRISLADLETGIYMVRIKNANGNLTTEKIIKK